MSLLNTLGQNYRAATQTLDNYKFAGGKTFNAGTPTVSDKDPWFSPLIGPAGKAIGGMGMNYAKKKGAPKFSHIDEKTGQSVYEVNDWANNMFDFPMQDGMVLKRDLDQAHKEFDYDKKYKEKQQAIKDAKTAEEKAKALAAAEAAEAEKKKEVITKENDIVENAKTGLTSPLSASSFANLAERAEKNLGDVATRGMIYDPDIKKMVSIGGVDKVIDTTNDLISRAAPQLNTWSWNSLQPEWLKGANDRALGEINDALTMFRRNGLDEYFSDRGTNPDKMKEYMSLQSDDGDYDQKKYQEWFYNNAYRLDEPVAMQRRRLEQEKDGGFFSSLGGDYDHTVFKPNTNTLESMKKNKIGSTFSNSIAEIF
jgi:hypothetical protein